MATRRLVTYRDPDTAYVRPAADVPGSAGWARTIAHDIAMLKTATAPQFTTIRYTPTWTDSTPSSSTTGWYLQVGQMCYVWAYNSAVTAMGSAGVGVSLPLTPSDSILPMIIGHGHLSDTSVPISYPFVVVYEEGEALFYWASSSTGGKVVDTDPVTISGGGDVFGVELAYRVDEPAVGRLNGSVYRLDEEYPD